MSQTRSFATPAIVLKRRSVGETDRLVTLLTQSHGKIVCVAKGVRKLTSSKRPFLEPGCLIQAFLVNTKSLPLLTQAKLLNDFAASKTDLSKIKQLWQILEIVDRLFAEGEEDNRLFAQVQSIMETLNSGRPSSEQIKHGLNSIITSLGYQSLQDSAHDSFLEYVAQLTDQPMRSWEYLTVK